MFQSRHARHWWAAASVFALAWSASAPAWAQQADDESEEIVVTAQRREQNVLDVGVAVQALSQTQLQDQHIEQLRDLNAALPNVSIKEQVPGAIPVITIRGVGLDDFSSTNSPAAGIYLDEVPLSSLALMSFDFYDLQRVEVVQGPQGTLYGRNTTAGAINVLSARPADHFEANIAAGYGNYERATVEGMLNVPLGHGAAFRLSGRYVDQNEGYWRSRLLPGTIGQQNVVQGRAQLAFGLGENWDVNLKLEGVRQRSDMGEGEHFGTVNFMTGSPPNFTCDPALQGRLDPTQCTDFLGYSDTDRNPWRGDWNSPHQYNIDQVGATARVVGDLGFATLTSITGYIDFSRDFYIDSDASPFRQFEFNQADDVRQFTQELRLNGETPLLNWTLGAFYSNDDIGVRTPGYLDDLFGTEVLITADQTDTSLAAFAQGEWRLNDRLSLITGVRFTHEEKDYTGGTLDENPFGLSMLINPFCPGAALPCQLSFVDTGIEDEFVSWRTGLNWHVTDDALIYASISRGQKSGGFFSGITLANAQLDPYLPEELTAYEVGFKLQAPAAHIRAEAAVFYYDYSDLQTFIRVDLGPVSVQALRNVPNATVRGLDASLSWQPIDGLTLQAGIGMLDTELGAFQTTAGPVAAGNELPNAPGVSGNVRAIYEWNVGSGLVARVQAGANMAGDSFRDALNDPLIAADRYTIYDARLSLGSESGNWEMALWGANLGDERYVVQGLNSGLGGGNLIYNAPRTYGVSVSRHF